MLITAGETLQDLPVTARLFADGKISWGQVRGIVRAVKRLPVAQRAVVDERIRRTVADHGGVDGFDADDLVWAVEQAVTELREPRSVERSEQRSAARDYLALQPNFDGGVRGWFEYSDPVAAATVVNGLDARAEHPAGAGDSPAHPDRRPDGFTTRAGQYARALVGLCADGLAGTTGAGQRKPARPLLLVHVDLAQIHANTAGQVELNVRGSLPTVTARTLEALATDADVRAVVFDGARPLAVSKKVRARAIPSEARVAVRARDKACRFPGSRDPAGHCDVHHVVHRYAGGDHSPDNLVLLSRRTHTMVHDHGWTLALDARDGVVTATRAGRSYRSLPRGTPLSPTSNPSGHKSKRPPRPPPAPPPDAAGGEADAGQLHF